MRLTVYSVPADGHVNPTLPVVRELVGRGVEVTYYLSEGYRARIEATGAIFRPYPGVADDYFEARGLNGSNPPMTAKALLGTSLEILAALLSDFERDQPDVILHDAMCPWGWLVAAKTGCPSVSSMATLVLTPPMILRSGQFSELAALMLRNIGTLTEYRNTAGQIRQRFSVRPPSFLQSLNGTAKISLNYTSARFQPNSETLDKSIKFVGPAIEPRPDPSNFPFGQLGAKPLIYISLGTIINDNAQFYRECLRAFDGSEYQVVMSIGRKIELESLGTIPANFIVRPFVPQLDILQRAALFISHAGLNSVHEALYYNVPLIVVPQQSEQNLTANRVDELGAGLKLAGATIPAVTLSDAAKRILNDDRFRQRASEVGESLRSAGGPRRAADEIQKLATKR